MKIVTFCKKNTARTGNILFQYMFCKLIELKYGFKYVLEEFLPADQKYDLTINDSNAEQYATNAMEISPDVTYILCDGFFQKSQYFVPYREELIEMMKTSEDGWMFNGETVFITDFFNAESMVTPGENDIVMSLRLDDFIQLPCKTSDIIPPDYYLNVLESPTLWFPDGSTHTPQLYIVCDKIRHSWEKEYLRFFDKFSPILVQGSLMSDCALMRNCNILLHSNSTLCWFMSFISDKTRRFIPKTNFYSVQTLNMIEITDTITNVSPLSHHAVYSLNKNNNNKRCIYPLSYAIPDEYVVSLKDAIERKTMIIADLIPGELCTYRFGHDDEDEYKKMYRNSLFAFTRKKGGWDCFRHYEIMANGCIPIFKELTHCPQNTLTTFPKELVMEANKELLPWKYENENYYVTKYLSPMLEHVRNHCTTSSIAKYFINKMETCGESKRILNVLMITGDCGVNYSRESLWIGVKRMLTEQGGTCMEYPRMNYLYDNFPVEDKKYLYGNGFTYSRTIKADEEMSLMEITEKINDHFWDLIVFGKMGPDEREEGSLPHMKLWDLIFKRYSKDEIAFIFGGDEPFDLNRHDRYYNHIMKHAEYGYCFVRELR